ncbi:MAG: GTP-binding protein [Deltaproteobacteria bacterium]|jgi:G3E family GTPase|nr:GTP-binding protein [Deltaproteobacteria bacterium]
MGTDIFIVAGLLGAGKTTTLRHVLAGGGDLSGTLAIVNEAARLGLDGRLVDMSGVPVFQLNNGCVCCSLQVDMVDLLRRLIAESRPRRIIMEASGLANPRRVSELIGRYVEGVGAVKTILVVEAEIWEAREAMGDFFWQSLGAADLLVLNKTEELARDRTEAISREISALLPAVDVVATSFGQIGPGLFFDQPAPREAARPGDTQAPLALEGYRSLDFESGQPFDGRLWEDFLEREGPGIERMKGQLSLTGGQFYFDWARGRASYGNPLKGLEGTRLVLIGQGLEAGRLLGILRGMLVP